MLKSLILVHGAGSGPWIFDGWEGSFPGLDVHAIDLHADLDIARASMGDYANAISSRAATMDKPVALCAWSMGGLAALMACHADWCGALILIEPSSPAETQGLSPGVPVEDGVFDPEEVYGPFPKGIAARTESSRARGERKRGISVPEVACPLLVISGVEFGEERGEAIAGHYGAEHATFPSLSHWQLVFSPDVRQEIAAFLNGLRTTSGADT